MRAVYQGILVFSPLILIVVIFFYLPVLESFLKSLQDLDGSYIGFDRYIDLLTDREFMDAFWLTIEVAFASTVISIILAIAISLALRDTFVGKKLALFLNQMNISTPHMIMATMMVYLLGQKGFISIVLYNMGLIDSWNEFPQFVEYTSPWGVIVSYTLKFTPFICLSVLAVLQSMSQDYEDQSITLGVGKVRTFFHVTLPSIWPAIMSTAIMSFTYAFGSFEVPMTLLTRKVLSTLVYNDYYDFYNPYGTLEGYAGSMIMTAIVMVLATIFLYISSKRSDALE